jgi:hypothetical protein
MARIPITFTCKCVTKIFLTLPSPINISFDLLSSPWNLRLLIHYIFRSEKYTITHFSLYAKMQNGNHLTAASGILHNIWHTQTNEYNGPKYYVTESAAL